jgi:hypothetical protein
MSDTEFSVFGLIFLLCLILLVSKLIATLGKVLALATLFRLPDPASFRSEDNFCLTSMIVPHNSPPLRI